MDLFDKFARLKEVYHGVTAVSSDPFNVCMEAVTSPTEAVIDGRRCVLAGSNNYLGLTFHPDAMEKACEAIHEQGVGTTGSRVANGTYLGHRRLEEELADFFGRRAAILYTTGYQANLGFISAMAGPDDTILIDSDCHASIYDGCKLGSATVIRFKHNDAADLDRRLRRLGAGSNKLVIIEGIYSMHGDRAPLADIIRVKKAHDAYLLVDEAHSLGVLGAHGRGLAEEAGLEADVDFIIGTFSKSIATIGGFCLSDHPDLDLVRLACRSYLFTASLPPSVVASARATLAEIRRNPEQIQRLWRNTDVLYDGLIELGYRLGPEKTPVIGVSLGSAEEAIYVWRSLLERGVYVNLALPPATPEGKFLLRCSVCAAHTREQLEQVLDAFAGIREEMTTRAAASS